MGLLKKRLYIFILPQFKASNFACGCRVRSTIYSGDGWRLPSAGFGYRQFTSILIGKAVFGDTTTTRNRRSSMSLYSSPWSYKMAVEKRLWYFHLPQFKASNCACEGRVRLTIYSAALFEVTVKRLWLSPLWSAFIGKAVVFGLTTTARNRIGVNVSLRICRRGRIRWLCCQNAVVLLQFKASNCACEGRVRLTIYSCGVV